MQTILLASGNAKKLTELRDLVSDLPVKWLTPSDLPDGLSEVDEDQPDFVGNAKKKALAAADDVALQFGNGPSSSTESDTEEIWTLADDSGLSVDALHGAPGVFSARYAGAVGVGKDSANNTKLLHEMKHVSNSERTAAFHCAIAVACKGEILFTVEGSVDGVILREADGSDGFGYDPLFYHAPSDTSFARLNAKEKARVSHRGVAVNKLRERLSALLD
jgi:XTP/dITP diphosphohydrolase